jgi:hypothetical protein
MVAHAIAAGSRLLLMLAGKLAVPRRAVSPQLREARCAFGAGLTAPPHREAGGDLNPTVQTAKCGTVEEDSINKWVSSGRGPRVRIHLPHDNIP